MHCLAPTALHSLPSSSQRKSSQNSLTQISSFSGLNASSMETFSAHLRPGLATIFSGLRAIMTDTFNGGFRKLPLHWSASTFLFKVFFFTEKRLCANIVVRFKLICMQLTAYQLAYRKKKLYQIEPRKYTMVPFEIRTPRSSVSSETYKVSISSS